MWTNKQNREQLTASGGGVVRCRGTEQKSKRTQGHGQEGGAGWEEWGTRGLNGSRKI